MYKDISDYTYEEQRAVYFYELLRERAETDTLSPLDQIEFEWAKQVLARRRARTNPPVVVAGYGYFTPQPGYIGLQFKVMGIAVLVVLAIIAFLALIFS